LTSQPPGRRRQGVDPQATIAREAKPMPREFQFIPRIFVDGKWENKQGFGPTDSTKLSDDEANDFESKVLDLLHDVLSSTQVAFNVFIELGTVAKMRNLTLTFAPPPPRPPETSVDIAETDPMNSLSAADRDDPEFRGVYDVEKRQGVGCSAVIYIRPDFVNELVSHTLVHEMVHAIRQMYGIWYKIPLPAPLSLFENEEEFFAMVVGNVNLSEMGRNWELRASHKVFKTLEAEHWTSALFLGPDDFGKAARRLMAKLQQQMPSFFFQMAKSVPPWLLHNPFKEFAENP
jgi:hypothetical protein